MDADPHVAAGFLMEEFLSETAGAWSQWAWEMTGQVYKDRKYQSLIILWEKNQEDQNCKQATCHVDVCCTFNQRQ